MMLIEKVESINFYRFRLHVRAASNPLETKAVIELEE